MIEVSYYRGASIIEVSYYRGVPIFNIGNNYVILFSIMHSIILNTVLICSHHVIFIITRLCHRQSIS